MCICPNPFLIMINIDYKALNHNCFSHFSNSRSRITKISKILSHFFCKILQTLALFLDSSWSWAIIEHFWTWKQRKALHSSSCSRGEASMEVEAWAGFVYSWTLHSSSFISRSLLEEIWGVAMLGSKGFQICSSRGRFFDLLNSPNHYVYLVDLRMAMNLHFESRKMMLYPWRFVHLKFGW